MTVDLFTAASLFAFALTWGVTESFLIAVVVGIFTLVAWLYLPLPRHNGTFGADTSRYWGFTK